jgi:putative lipoprotein
MPRQDAPKIVKGEVLLPAGALPAGHANLIVQVEDVSRADAPSQIVGEHRQTGIVLRQGGALPFTIKIPSELIDENHSYSVRAHIDVSGSGDVTKGDLVSTQAHPVLSRGYGTTVRVPVKSV